MLLDYEIYELVNIYATILGVVFGAVLQKNQFCFSGSIKDYILTNSTKRASSVLMAIIMAIISTKLISYTYNIDLSQSIYFKDNINYFSIMFGGALFGVGMVLADGCASRHIIKFAQGDLRSLIVIIFIAISAYMSTKGILYNIVSSISLNQTLLELSFNIKNIQLNIYAVLAILFTFLWVFVKNTKRILLLKDGFLVGISISAGWYITGVIGADSMDRIIPLSSITSIYPAAKTLEFITYYEVQPLSFGISMIFGMFIGAFLMSKINTKYSFGCTSSFKTSKLKNSIIGGVLMRVGGVMAIGCTIGQGLSGISTLATASFIAIFFIYIFGYITAFILNKNNLLPSCFTFDWEDK